MNDLAATVRWPAPAAAHQHDFAAIPGYEILEELGRGGMGIVFKARQLSSNRPVALKLIRDGAMAGPEDRARFRAEAEVVARVRHVNVVQIHETGEHQGWLYFAMEYVEGGSLARHLFGRPQLAVPAARLVRTLAAAIQYAHAQQIIHRDLKPANILLRSPKEGREEDSAGVDAPTDVRPSLDTFVPLITDFGLAKRLNRESTAWTQDGVVLGTASYMSPEQAAGRVRDIGPAVDVYALGAILYELLTGRPPFQADTPSQTIEQVLYDEPTPPTRLHAAVPRDLETICLKCLEKEPDRRYASPADLADDLDRFLVGQQIAAVPPSEFERLSRLAARDGYQIIGEIGRGPRSTVYRALSGPLEQIVALKVFAPGICSDEEWVSRVRRGAAVWGNILSNESLAAVLAHPNIAAVHKAGCWDGTPFVATEYVPHGCLTSRLASHNLKLCEVLPLVDQVAQTVVYLHRQGIVHGNLKPSNVLFAADGIIKITDFRPIGGLFQGPLPADGSPAGIGYLTPEFAGGHTNAEPRPYTDIYGLGLILYESLAGRPPFAAANVPETLEQVRSHDPLPPSRFNPDVTPQLDAFCLRCLRKDPWKRFRRAFDVSSRLRGCLNQK
jgi:serine/threonine protein kinase